MSSSDETTTRTGDAMRLLEILTPGGSEFHENPQRCAAWVQERLDSAQRLTVRAYTERNEMRQENARLRERVAALEGAVKSFARAKAEWDRLWDDTESLKNWAYRMRDSRDALRAAEAALVALAQADDGGRA